MCVSTRGTSRLLSFHRVLNCNMNYADNQFNSLITKKKKKQQTNSLKEAALNRTENTVLLYASSCSLNAMNDLGQSCMEMSGSSKTAAGSESRWDLSNTHFSSRSTGSPEHTASPAPPTGGVGDLHGPSCPVRKQRAAGDGNP